MITDEIRKELFLLQDEKYRDFQKKLIPTVKEETIIGVRTPALRNLAKQFAAKEGIDVFLTELPHPYFDENQLHAFIIAADKDFAHCIYETERFLPFIDNWATCDQLSPKVFKKHHDKLLSLIKKWICSDETYTVRFSIGMLMEHFLNDDFDSAYLDMVADVQSEEYYINMMRAWYFATALAKQYDAAVKIIEKRALDTWTHNKTIQKAAESYRITLEQKEYLKSMKIPLK